MLICPQCRTPYPHGGDRCTRDGVELVEHGSEPSPSADPLIGTTLVERFVIEDRIGLGGMGAVYRATQIGLGRKVALKILKPEVSLKRDAVTRFEREAKAMSLLVHANTVRVFDFGESPDGLLYLAMELLEGEVLTKKSRREGVLDVTDAVRIVQQILASLHEAHTKGLIHRDLKPDNIFLARVEGHAEPVVKVLDFGIAKAWQGQGKLDQFETQAGTVFGTPRYMSPEQAQGSALDPRSDIYGVGTLLYQLLAGEAPFVDDDAVVVMAKHIREAPTPVRRAAPEQPIPARLERAVMRSLAKDPSRRFQSAQAFIDELEACIPAVAELRAGSGPYERFFGDTSPGIVVASGGLLFGAVVLAAIILLGPGSEPEPTPRPVVAAEPPAASEAPTTSEAPSSSEAPRAARAPNAAEAEGSPDPATRDARLTSEPSGAEVWSGDTLLGTTPLAHALESEEALAVELRLEGHRPARVLLSPGIERNVELHRRSRARSRARARRAPMRRANRATRRTDGETRRAQDRSGSAAEPQPTAEPSKASPFGRFTDEF
jgi:serine/threonine-protein kinase